VPEERKQKAEAYRASIERLTKANADLRTERGRYKWVAIATLVVAPILYFASGMTAMIIALIVGGSVFGVGQYVVFAHIQENKLTIKSARQMLDTLAEDSRS